MHQAQKLAVPRIESARAHRGFGAADPHQVAVQDEARRSIQFLEPGPVQNEALVLGERHRWHAVRGHLHELGGDLPAAATAYADAARRATDVAERDHLVRQAARARVAELRSGA